jgi:hypothetical protein
VGTEALGSSELAQAVTRLTCMREVLISIPGRDMNYPDQCVSYGRAISQVLSRRLPTAAAQILSKIRSFGICGGQNDTGTHFL